MKKIRVHSYGELFLILLVLVALIFGTISKLIITKQIIKLYGMAFFFFLVSIAFHCLEMRLIKIPGQRIIKICFAVLGVLILLVGLRL